jgi:hypothetical protein
MRNPSREWRFYLTSPVSAASAPDTSFSVPVCKLTGGRYLSDLSCHFRMSVFAARGMSGTVWLPETRESDSVTDGSYSGCSGCAGYYCGSSGRAIQISTWRRGFHASLCPCRKYVRTLHRSGIFAESLSETLMLVSRRIGFPFSMLRVHCTYWSSDAPVERTRHVRLSRLLCCLRTGSHSSRVRSSHQQA